MTQWTDNRIPDKRDTDNRGSTAPSYSILLSSQTRLLTPGHTNLNRTEVTTRIEPKTSAALPIIRCALSTELSRGRGNVAQNGAKKTL